MFIITGNNTVTQQVRILDTSDMHEDWYSYEFMRRGIAQGLEIKGLDANSNIMLQQPSLVTEFGARLDLLIAKCIAFKNKGALLNLLKPYGLVESEEDIDIDYNHCRLRNLNRVINKNYEDTMIGVSLKDRAKFTPLVKNIVEELMKIPYAGRDGISASLTHIIKEENNKYTVLLDGISAELELKEVTPDLATTLQPDIAESDYIYYLNKLKKSLQDNNFRHKYFISSICFHDDISTEAHFYECDVNISDIIFGEPLVTVLNANTILVDQTEVSFDDIMQGISDFSDENCLSLSTGDIEQTAKDIWNSLQTGLQKYPSDLIELSL